MFFYFVHKMVKKVYFLKRVKKKKIKTVHLITWQVEWHKIIYVFFTINHNYCLI